MVLPSAPRAVRVCVVLESEVRRSQRGEERRVDAVLAVRGAEHGVVVEHPAVRVRRVDRHAVILRRELEEIARQNEVHPAEDRVRSVILGGWVVVGGVAWRGVAWREWVGSQVAPGPPNHRR